MEQLKGLILSGGKGTRLRRSPTRRRSSSCRSPTSRCCSTASRRWRPRASARSGSSSRRRPAARSARRPATASIRRQITYIEQDAPLGLAHAVLTAEPFLGSDPFVMYLGDNLLQGGIEDLVAAFRRNQPEALILLTQGPGPAELRRRRARRRRRRDAAGGEAAEPASDLALVGVYMFTPRIHEAARAIQPSGARRARDHRRDPVARGRRARRRVAHRARLVEGHRPPGRHARGQPPDPRDARAARRGRARRLPDRGPRRDRGRRGARAHDRPRPGDHRRRRAPDRRLHRPVHRGRPPLRDRVGGDRALDPARGLVRRGPRRAHGVLAARARRRRSPAATASRAPTASWSATRRRSGSL